MSTFMPQDSQIFDQLDSSIEEIVSSFRGSQMINHDHDRFKFDSEQQQKRQLTDQIKMIHDNTPKSSFLNSNMAKELISNMDKSIMSKFLDHFKSSVNDQEKMAQLAQQMLIEMINMNSSSEDGARNVIEETKGQIGASQRSMKESQLIMIDNESNIQKRLSTNTGDSQDHATLLNININSQLNDLTNNENDKTILLQDSFKLSSPDSRIDRNNQKQTKGDLINSLYQQVHKEQGEEALKLAIQIINKTPLSDTHRFAMSSTQTSKIQQMMSVQILVLAHYLILNKSELFTGYGNSIHKYKNIIFNVEQNFLIMAELYLQLDEIIQFSTNNVSYLNLRRRVNQKLAISKKQNLISHLKQSIDIISMCLKKLLRQSIIKSVGYIQQMLEILSTLENQTYEEASQRLTLEKERFIKKSNDPFGQKRSEAHISSRSTTPRDQSLTNITAKKMVGSFSTNALSSLQQQLQRAVRHQDRSNTPISERSNSRTQSKAFHQSQFKASSQQNNFQSSIADKKTMIYNALSSPSPNKSSLAQRRSRSPNQVQFKENNGYNTSSIQKVSNSSITQNMFDGRRLSNKQEKSPQINLQESNLNKTQRLQYVSSMDKLGTQTTNFNVAKPPSMPVTITYNIRNQTQTLNKKSSQGSLQRSPARIGSPYRDPLINNALSKIGKIEHYQFLKQAQKKINPSTLASSRIQASLSMKNLQKDPSTQQNLEIYNRKHQKQQISVKENSLNKRIQQELPAANNYLSQTQKLTSPRTMFLSQQPLKLSSNRTLKTSNQFNQAPPVLTYNTSNQDITLIDQQSQLLNENLYLASPNSKNDSVSYRDGNRTQNISNNANISTKKKSKKKKRPIPLVKSSEPLRKTNKDTQSSSSQGDQTNIMFDIVINKNKNNQQKEQIEKEIMEKVQQAVNVTKNKLRLQQLNNYVTNSGKQIDKEVIFKKTPIKIADNLMFNVNSADSSFDDHYQTFESKTPQNRKNLQITQDEEISTDKITERLENLDEDYIIEQENVSSMTDLTSKNIIGIQISLPIHPYLPPISSNREYTLVMDLDETLIHYDVDDQEQEGFYLIRPGALKFLYEMKHFFEIVVFTAAIPEYADWIIDSIDPDKCITHRLYRQHTTPQKECALKDLRKLGRPLEKTIIVDNIEENYKETSYYNGIRVRTWIDDMDDRVLELLGPFLKQIVLRKIQDIRVLFQNFKHKVENSLDEGNEIPQFDLKDMINVNEQV
ncbi:nli interacting factor-like phosphatase family protein [Stylonychia lemnae]|uniref:Nli interacting factor-like phosphatase family protein n=1 Tax=Stylonychia lemnae TaxID=5949 RepID=A0A077ZN37_STYLE|nr:nli interacting factor-like phosphatase family protein [Stylonychia lemnae]|eukprot:CDW71328.1 nli interacting factor-like phosphatase family protein [Stylonychia lemnae]